MKNNLLYYERKYWVNNKYIVGLDEVGRGAWAGPIVVAGCILPRNYKNNEINDSKKLSRKKREKLFDQIKKDAIATLIYFIDAPDVDKFNPKNASILGMEYICNNILPKPSMAFVDAEQLKKTKVKTLSIVHGDSKSISIAAASILAKVTRDRYMEQMDNKYPGYYFTRHKGYGTMVHLNQLYKYGPIKNFHRFSYRSIKEVMNKLALKRT